MGIQPASGTQALSIARNNLQYLDKHTVQDGESLSSIAKKVETNVETLARLNNISDFHEIRVGQKIYLPTYKVKVGDRLSVIAGKLGISQKNIEVLNGISNPNIIKVGQTLRVIEDKKVTQPSKDSTNLTAPTSRMERSQIEQVHIVGRGDTLSGIANKYGVSVDDLRKVNHRKKEDDRKLQPGDKLIIPNKENPQRPQQTPRHQQYNPLPIDNSVPDLSGETLLAQTHNGLFTSDIANYVKALGGKGISAEYNEPRTTYQNKKTGKLETTYGDIIPAKYKEKDKYTQVGETRHHHGIDINLDKSIVKPHVIPSMLDGKVVFVKDKLTGNETKKGFGYYVKIETVLANGEKVTAIYAHMANPPAVKLYKQIKAGEIIGLVGSTGGSTGAHLHLQFDVDKQSVNPVAYVAYVSKVGVKQYGSSTMVAKNK